MNATPTRPITSAEADTPLDRAYLRAPRVPSFDPARIEWLDGTVETFASFWDAWNSVEDRYSVTSDGRIFSLDGFELGQVVS